MDYYCCVHIVVFSEFQCMCNFKEIVRFVSFKKAELPPPFVAACVLRERPREDRGAFIPRAWRESEALSLAHGAASRQCCRLALPGSSYWIRSRP